MNILEGGLTNPKVVELLAAHLRQMQESSPSESVFALDFNELRAPEIRFWVAWQQQEVLGCGALKMLSEQQAEIKSMRTHSRHLRKGVAANVLEHIISEARSDGFSILSLETGSGPAFDPALSLYRKYGFTSGDAFADYQKSEFNQFLHLNLR